MENVIKEISMCEWEILLNNIHVLLHIKSLFYFLYIYVT